MAYYPNHTTSSVNHDGGNVISGACMTVSGTGSLLIINDVITDRSI